MFYKRGGNDERNNKKFNKRRLFDQLREKLRDLNISDIELNTETIELNTTQSTK